MAPEKAKAAAMPDPAKAKPEATINVKVERKADVQNLLDDKAKAKLEQEKANLEKEKARLEQEKTALEHDKAKLKQENTKLEQEKTKLMQDKSNLSKDNSKLAQDYQTLERKHREEVGKAKSTDEKAKLLEKKLEIAGLNSTKSVHGGQPTNLKSGGKLVSEGRYRPTLEYPISPLTGNMGGGRS